MKGIQYINYINDSLFSCLFPFCGAYLVLLRFSFLYRTITCITEDVIILVVTGLRKFTCGNKRLEFNQDALIKFQALNCWLHHTLFISL